MNNLQGKPLYDTPEQEVKAYMMAELEEGNYRDSAGEIDCTAMGEDAAWNFDWDVTDLDTLFEWSFDVYQEYTARAQESAR